MRYISIEPERIPIFFGEQEISTVRGAPIGAGVEIFSCPQTREKILPRTLDGGTDFNPVPKLLSEAVPFHGDGFCLAASDRRFPSTFNGFFVQTDRLTSRAPRALFVGLFSSLFFSLFSCARARVHFTRATIDTEAIFDF
jgi:hypothetical protein